MTHSGGCAGNAGLAGWQHDRIAEGPDGAHHRAWERACPRYPPKAILGTAYELATGHRLASDDFEGGKAGAVRVLEQLGFTVELRHPAGQSGWSERSRQLEWHPDGDDHPEHLQSSQGESRVEYLVDMTTHVPEGTSSEAVDDVRGREAAHTRELAGQGHVLRLWRPPLAPGQWRTIGLFAADDAAGLEQVLASMPLRVWRTDEVTELSAHRNDPGPAATATRPPQEGEPTTEFLVSFTSALPQGTVPADVAEATANEVDRVRELVREGHIGRLWGMPPEHGEPRILGLFLAADEAEVQAILESLPLAPYAKAQTTRLTPHPSDPATSGNRGGSR
jgi:muconolactone delta-isomerase